MSDLFQEVKERLSLEVVAGEYGVVFGRNRKALCFLHDDHNPSLSLLPDGKAAFCHPCDKKVDVIDIEMHFGHHAHPIEAANALNIRHRLNVPINGFDEKAKEKHDERQEAHKLLLSYCDQLTDNLLNNQEAREWLRETKGITDEIIKKNRIGYVGPEGIKDRTDIRNNLPLAVKLGLVKKIKDAAKKDGFKYMEYFKSRLIFPVFQYGKIVSIHARAFPDNMIGEYSPKWLGLPHNEETHNIFPFKPIHKPENLNREICLVVEGIPDGLALESAGFYPCSPLGTNISQANSGLFKNAKTKKLIFAYDPDGPGEGAAYKLAREYKGYIFKSQYDKDFDELLVELGPEKFKDFIENGIANATFYLDAVIEREKWIDVLPYINNLSTATDKDIWLYKLAKHHKKDGITIKSLRTDLEDTREKKTTEPQSNEHIICDPKPTLHPAMSMFEGNLLYGSFNQTKPIYLSNRQIINPERIALKYKIGDDPRQLRFTAKGVKEYLDGREPNIRTIINGINNLLNRHLIFQSNWQSITTTLWIIGTYLHRCFPLFPYLWIQSPTKRCGKTRLLELISELAFNSDGIQTAPTQAVLYRVPAITAGTLSWDEAENLYDSKEKGERLEILNAAYRKGSQIPRCEGDDNEIKFFEVYRPIVLAGINTAPDTIRDRSLKIELIRKRKDDTVERLQVDLIQAELQELRDELHIFALTKTPEILAIYHNKEIRSQIPKYGDDRLGDALEILYAIAKTLDLDLEWVLEKAAMDLTGVREDDEDDLSFIKAIWVFKEYLEKYTLDETVLTTNTIIGLFQEGEMSWVKEPKDIRGIMSRLRIRSKAHRLDSETVIRGYKIELNKIEDYAKRYLVEIKV